MGKIITPQQIVREQVTGITEPLREYVKQEISKYAQFASAQIAMESETLRVEMYLLAEQYDRVFVSCFSLLNNPLATPKNLIDVINQMYEIKDKLSDDFFTHHAFCDRCFSWLLEVRKSSIVDNKKVNEINNVLVRGIKDDKKLD